MAMAYVVVKARYPARTVPNDGGLVGDDGDDFDVVGSFIVFRRSSRQNFPLNCLLNLLPVINGGCRSLVDRESSTLDPSLCCCTSCAVLRGMQYHE